MSTAEQKVAAFYENVGWESAGTVTEDAKRYEDLRECAREYVSRCRLRVLRHIPPEGTNLLDMASGPIQYDEYLEYSKGYEKRYCVDLSAKALAAAEKRIGDHGVFLCGSFFDIGELRDDFFDCAISLHTIYHIDRDRQEEAVRKLIRLTRPGRPVIIVYTNPNTWIGSIESALYWLKPRRVAARLKRWVTRRSPAARRKQSDLYYYGHPLGWWNRFEDEAELRILPWRSFSSRHQKMFFPDNRLGRGMLRILFRLEERFPGFFVRHFQYPMIVLKRRG
jgi:ubiquinone/menaquinone biosynthesis C-methylase UbiE